MYTVTLKPNKENREYTLHNLQTNELALINPKLVLELNKTGTLTFSVPVTHPYYNKVAKMQCEINVYKNSQLIYVGRPLNSEEDFYRTSSVTCEGILAYLLDSIQRPYEYTGNINDFFTALITNHNKDMGSNDYKKFAIGTCDVVDNNNYINRSDSNYTTTLNTITDKLIASHGGYIGVSYLNGSRYIDYKAIPGRQNTQTINFGNNLLDLTQYIKSDNLITAIIPLGAETEEKGINDTNRRVTIASVNNNKDYLIDETSAKVFGLIYGVVEFDDVTSPANLKTKALQYLKNNNNLSLTIELSAVDMSMLDRTIESYSLGDTVRVISSPHNLDSYFLLSKYEIDLVDISKNKITLGKTLNKLSSAVTQNQNNATIQLIKKTNALNHDISTAVENATQLITGSQGGYLYHKLNADGQPEELYILDSPSIDDAVNVIRLNKNGLGFSRTGYQGAFQNAWTIDGSLVADFITTGSLSANLIKTGKIISNNNSKVYFDLENGELSGSVLVDTNPNSNLTAKFGTTTIDNLSYKGFIIFDKNNNNGTMPVSDVGGIIRYADSSEASNIGLYSKGNLVLSGYGLDGSGSSITLRENSLFINRKVGKDEVYENDVNTILYSAEDKLSLQYVQTNSKYSKLEFTEHGTTLLQQFPQTTSSETSTNSGITFERGKINLLIDNKVMLSASAGGITINGTSLQSILESILDRISALEAEIKELKNT